MDSADAGPRPRKRPRPSAAFPPPLAHDARHSASASHSPDFAQYHSSPEPSDPKTPKKPGRKRTETPADDRRTAQNRLAQRAFRDRKLQYVKDLETKVEQLTAIVEGNSEFSEAYDCFNLRNQVAELESKLLAFQNSAPDDYRSKASADAECLNCASERLKLEQLTEANNQLQASCIQLQDENNVYKQLMSTSSLFASTSSANPALQDGAPLLPSTYSATPLSSSLSPVPTTNNLSNHLLLFNNGILQEMSYSPSSSISLTDDIFDLNKEREFTPSFEQFGPITVDLFREKLKSLSSLENSSVVDDFMELIMILSKCSTKRSLKRLIIRFAALKHKLLDTCSLIEKQAFLELTENFKTEIKKHMDFFYSQLRTTSVAQNRKPLSELQAKVLEQLQQFKDMAKAIPSFKDAESLVDDLCFEFSSQALCKDETEREEKYVQVMAIQGQLQMLCETEDDRTKSARMSPRSAVTGNQYRVDNDECHSDSAEQKKRSHSDNEDPADKRRRQVRKRQQTYTEDLEAHVARLTAVLNAHGISVPPSSNGKRSTATAAALPSSAPCCGALSELAAENRMLQLQLDEQKQKCRELSASLAALQSCGVSAPQPVCAAPGSVAVKQAASPTESAQFSEAYHAPAPDLTDGASATTGTNLKVPPVTPMRTAISGLVENDDISSSVEMFGNLQLESFSQKLKTIGVRNDWATEFVMLLEKMALCTNRCVLRSLLVRYSELYNDAVECIGRDKHSLIVEVLETAKISGSNSSHWKHWYQSIAANLEFDSIMEINAPNMPKAQAQLLKDLEIFQKEILAIPSVADRGHLVQALCVEFAALTISSPDQNEKHYANVLAIQGLLQGLCETPDERRMFMLTLEIARDVAKKYLGSFSGMPRTKKESDDYDEDAEDCSQDQKNRNTQPDQATVDRRRQQVRQRQQHYTVNLEERVAALSAVLKANGIALPSSSALPSSIATPTKISSTCGCNEEIASLTAQKEALQRQLAGQIRKADELSKSLASVLSDTSARVAPHATAVRLPEPQQHTLPRAPSNPPDLADTASVLSTRVARAGPSAKSRIADLVENDDITASTELFGEYQLDGFTDWLRITSIPAYAAREFVDLMKGMATCTNRTTLRKMLVDVSLLKNAFRNIVDSDGHPVIVEILELSKKCGSNALHWAFKLSNPNEREKHHANVLATQGLLQSLCETAEERKSFMIALEGAKAVVGIFDGEQFTDCLLRAAADAAMTVRFGPSDFHHCGQIGVTEIYAASEKKNSGSSNFQQFQIRFEISTSNTRQIQSNNFKHQMSAKAEGGWFANFTSHKFSIADASDMKGKVVLITGGSSGIGKVNVRQFAELGAKVYVVGRNKEKTVAVIEAAKASSKNPEIFFILGDMDSLASIRAAAQEFLSMETKLHVLICNAGTVSRPKLWTEDGFEILFGQNYLSHVLLTTLLLPCMKETAKSLGNVPGCVRIVNLSSVLGESASPTIDMASLRKTSRPSISESDTESFSLYGRAKLCQMLGTIKLAQTLANDGISVYALHPGVVASGIWNAKGSLLTVALNLWKNTFMISEEDGSLTTLFCATSAKVAAETGLYYDKCASRPFKNKAVENQPLIDELWTNSLEWIKLPN
ncbi:hypothetical protein HDU82_004425 [Entophlyctis luteolus]|nr:hypothetical protein HDU82_004425 [Entophlyctis luteolus]